VPSSRVRAIGFSSTLAIAELARQLREQGTDVIDFSAGQPDFPTPEAVKLAGKRAIDENRTGYTATAGIAELRAAIATRFRAERGLDYPSEAVLVSCGAKASLFLAFQALLEPGDEAIVPVPYWTSYPEQVKLAGGRPVFVRCRAERGFRLEPQELARAITPRTRLVILNSPANPTGASYRREELAPLAELCVERGLWVVADEIYSKLVYDGERFCGIADLGAAIRSRTVIVDGVSKTYSMTGWRIGFAVGPSEVIAGMTKLQSHSTSHATSIAQWAALAALALPDDEIRPRVDEFRRRRDELLRGLAQVPGWSCTVPEGSFYLFPAVAEGPAGPGRPGALRDGDAVARYLLEHAAVAVVPGAAFGAPGHVRLSYAVSLERVREGVARIARAMAAARGADP